MGVLDLGIDVLCITRYDYHSETLCFPHSHQCSQLTYLFDGEGDVVVDGKRLHVGEHTLLYFSPGSLHYIDTIREKIKSYNIKFHITDPNLKKKAGFLPEAWKVPTSMLDSFIDIHAIGMEKPIYYMEKCELKITSLLFEFLSLVESNDCFHHKESGVNPELSLPIQKILNFFCANYHIPITAEIIGEEGGYSYRYLSTLFNKKFGIAPIGYLERLRIEKAKDLIRNSDFGLKIIAEMTGFHSVHYFSSVFKKQTGYPPGEWRNKEKIGIGKDILLKEGYINKKHMSRQSVS